VLSSEILFVCKKIKSCSGIDRVQGLQESRTGFEELCPHNSDLLAKNRAFGQRESFYRIRLTRGSVAKSKEILKILLAQGEADRDRIVKSFFVES